MVLVALLASDAFACGNWHASDVELGATIEFVSPSVRVRYADGRRERPFGVVDHLDPAASAWVRATTLEQIDTRAITPPPYLRWDWSSESDRPAMRLDMDGTLLRRMDVAVGEWIDARRLRLGADEYHFELTPFEDTHLGAMWKVRVTRGDTLVLRSDEAASLCTFDLKVDDVEREIRTRLAFWLAYSRGADVAFTPEVRRVEATAGEPGARRTVTATATTELREGARTYGAAALGDGDPATAWCEGDRGYGIGARITMKTDATDPRLVVVPGYARDAARWRGNAQARRLLVETDTGVATSISFPYAADPTGPYLIPLDAPGTTELTVTLVEVWPGERWDDACLSELGLVD